MERLKNIKLFKSILILVLLIFGVVNMVLPVYAAENDITTDDNTVSVEETSPPQEEDLLLQKK